MEGRFNGRFFALQVWGAYTYRDLFSDFYVSFSFSGTILWNKLQCNVR